MQLIFLIKTATVDISNYTIKDISGSSGRLDVISRCILSALLEAGQFSKDIEIWIFLDKYGTYKFLSNHLIYETFPKNELLLTDCIVKMIQGKNKEILHNPLNSVQFSNESLISILKNYQNDNKPVYVLHEKGENLLNHKEEFLQKQSIIFVVGNQTGEYLDIKEFQDLNLPTLNLGTQSYLASSVIRLIKLQLLSNV